jgi:hypothetical protein
MRLGTYNTSLLLLRTTLHRQLSILQATLMKSAVSIAVEGLEDGCVTMMTSGNCTSSGSQSVSTNNTLRRVTSNALILLLLMMVIATCQRINSL